MEQSRFGHYHTSRVHRHKRSKVVPGSFENRNKFYECWNCGFVFDLSKITTGLDHDSRYQTETIYTESPTLSGDPIMTVMYLDSPFVFGTMLELGPDGITPKSIFALRNHNAGPGCPLCGTTNLP